MRNNDLKFQIIKAPDLNSSEYGKNIKDQFENINSNFIKLSNYDFVKGKDGDPVELKVVNIDNIHDEFSMKIKKSIINAIENHIPKGTEGHNPLSPVRSEGVYISWDDNFLTPSQVILMIKNNIIISSMAYIYIDPRFYNNDITSMALENGDLYDYLIDCSCVVYFDKYDDNGNIIFKCIDAFPTLYFDEGNFCWKIWGQKTGLIANGPKGLDASQGTVSVKRTGRQLQVVNIQLNK